MRCETMADNEVVMTTSEFEKLIKKLAECKIKLAKCGLANKFLNEQIAEYNEKFTKESHNEE